MLAAVLLVGAGACSDDNGPGGLDGGIGSPDQGAKSTYELVLTEFSLPENTAAAQQQARDLDNDGVKDNVLGNVVVGLSGLFPAGALNLKSSPGSVLFLFQVHAASTQADPAADLHIWYGKDLDDDPDNNLDGNQTFGVDPSSPKNMTFKGQIAGGVMTFGPGELALLVPMLQNVAPLSLPLQGALVEGRLAADGKSIREGNLAGAVNRTTLEQEVMPVVGMMIREQLADPETSTQVKNGLLSIFDSDNDGSISDDEVANNALVKLMLAPDVDLDGDGVKESVSMAVGFTAISCSIDAK